MKVLPSSHLLSIHVSERHDAYFAALARRGDRLVFECLVEGCGCTFVSDAARRAHLTVSHAYPKSFRFHRKPRPRKLQSQQPHTGATSASHAPDLRLPLSGSTKGVVPPAAAAPLIPLNAKSNWNNRSNPREECQDSCSRNDMEADSATSNEAPEAPAAQQQQQQWRRRPKKQRNPATTPCFFHTRTEKGCVRGDKCPFVHGERLVAGDGGDFAAKTADVATLGRYRSHSDADSDVDTGGGGDGMDSDDDMPVPNRSIAASSKGEPADAMTLDAADNNENLGNDLVDSVAKLRFMPRQISFGRRGGSHAGFSKS